MQERTVSSFDGTTVAYQRFGSGPPLLIGNGIGVDWRGLQGLVERLARRRSLILWDYRGTFRSGRPEAGSDFDVAAHARDVLAVIDDAAIARPVDYLGWSMGAQVGFELVRLAPGLMRRFVALSGVTGNPLETAFGLPQLSGAIRSGVRLGLRYHRLVHTATRRAPELPLFLSVVKGIGWVHRRCEEEHFMTMARGVAAADKQVYLSCLLGLMDHDASDVADAIDFPVLILAGGRDYVTPLATAERMHAQIATSELVVLDDCTHYAVVEQPERVSAEVERFLG